MTHKPESAKYRQKQIDQAPDYATALHRWRIAEAMEEVAKQCGAERTEAHRKPKRKDYSK